MAGPSEETRSTALDPDLLTAEIGLLLDYLSGLPVRNPYAGISRIGASEASRELIVVSSMLAGGRCIPDAGNIYKRQKCQAQPGVQA